MAIIKTIAKNIIDHTTVDKTTKDTSLIFFLKAKAIGYAKAIDPVINALIRKIVKNIKPCIRLFVTFESFENILDRLFRVNTIKIQ